MRLWFFGSLSWPRHLTDAEHSMDDKVSSMPQIEFDYTFGSFDGEMKSSRAIFQCLLSWNAYRVRAEVGRARSGPLLPCHHVLHTQYGELKST